MSPGFIASFALSGALGVTAIAPAAAQDKATPARVVNVVSNPPTAVTDKPAPATATPIGSPASWFTANDYPPDAIRAGQQGRVVVRVSIDSTGAVTDCTITVSSSSASLDAATCRLVRLRAHFLPAHDGTGRTIASIYPFATRWVLPTQMVGPTAWYRTVYRIDPSGKLLSCTGTSGPVAAGEYTKLCSFAKDLSVDMLMNARGPDSGSSVVDVIDETSIVIDDDPAPHLAFDDPDHVPISLVALNFDVSATGEVSNCTVAVKIGPDKPFCSNPPGPFAPMPGGKTRHVKTTIASSRYVEP
jgi:TonB family protein